MILATVVVFEMIFVASEAPAGRHPGSVILQNAIKRMRRFWAPDPGNGRRFCTPIFLSRLKMTKAIGMRP